MKERPILFSGPMVRAILRDVDPKTQTRRRVKVPPGYEFTGKLLHTLGYPASEGHLWAEFKHPDSPSPIFIKCPYGQPGDRLWCKETFATGIEGCPDGISYRADHLDPRGDGPANPMKWRPSIFMPRWASRITLGIVSVRVERVQEISEADAKAEGVTGQYDDWAGPGNLTFRKPYKKLWDSINGKSHPWDNNDWVWVIELRRLYDSEQSSPGRRRTTSGT